MKFYVLENKATGETVSCQITVKACMEIVDTMRVHEYRIDCVECDVSPETIRRLLGQMGGYCNTQRVARESKDTHGPLGDAPGFLDRMAEASHVLDGEMPSQFSEGRAVNR